MQSTKRPTSQSRADLYKTLIGTAHSAQPDQVHSLQGSSRDFELYSALDYSIQTTVATDTRAIARTA